MDWALNEKSNGAYATGTLKIGKEGDFVTSPSLGCDFAELLAVQIVDWFDQLDNANDKLTRLCLIEIGPGEGQLSKDLIKAIDLISPSLLNRIELILIEENEGMMKRQKENLKELPINKIAWKSIRQLSESPVEGIILANEFIDALPVERLIFRNKKLYRQGIQMFENDGDRYIKYIDLPLTQELSSSINEVCSSMGFLMPPAGIKEGWSTEWHNNLNNILFDLDSILTRGILLVIDYALESFRYYNSTRDSGTVIAYKKNKTSTNILNEPGNWDITTHICLETLFFYAKENRWNYMGHVRQGEALLALGLAERIHSLQHLANQDLSLALEKRESLLRLVDPLCLGGFYWIAFQKNNDVKLGIKPVKIESKFLKEPLFK
tara:strand:- start:4568 stop:5704 length:1137 start_codon:yes stop_codon:yes gene_type:complete